MATIREIREGLASALSGLPGLNESPYMRSAPTAPSTEVFPGEVTYDAAMGRGIDFMVMIVRVTAAANLDEASQMRLDEFLAPSGATSVKAALEADRTLGGAVHTLRVSSASGYQVMQVADQKYLACDWTVELWPAGTV